MADWLRFMTRLAEAQHAVAGAMGPVAGLIQAVVEQPWSPRAGTGLRTAMGKTRFGATKAANFLLCPSCGSIENSDRAAMGERKPRP
jgi:hypothetical protein